MGITKLLIYVYCLIYLATFSTSCQPVDQPKTANLWNDEDRKVLIDGLTSTLDTLVLLVSDLSAEEWQFQYDRSQWNIGQVVTHLAIHDALFYRELRSSSSLPYPAAITDSMLDKDETLLDYGHITADNVGEAPWYLLPDQRWCNQHKTVTDFVRSRKAYVEFIKETDADLRRYYSTNGRGLNQYRDLHQLILISIVHTRRHLKQIKKIIDQLEQNS